MLPRPSIFPACAIFLLACWWAAPISRAQFVYTAVDLGTLGGTWSKATGVNDSGQVVGTSSIGSASHSFLYTSGHLIDLNAGTFGVTSSTAYDINSFGQVVGQVDASSSNPQYGFLYSGGALSAVPGLTSAHGINDNGDIIGQNTNAYVQQASIYHTRGPLAGTRTDLGTLGGPISSATDINNTGTVIGSSMTSSATMPFIAQASSSSSMSPIAGLSAYATVSAINDLGMIVGSSSSNPFLLDHGAFVDLGTVGANVSFLDLNNAGTIVGRSVPAVNTQFAIVYSGGVVQNLNTITNLAGTNFASLEEAVAISNTGYIVGNGRTTSGTLNAFLLTPTLTAVPEPSTYALIAALSSLAPVVWRRRPRSATTSRCDAESVATWRTGHRGQ